MLLSVSLLHLGIDKWFPLKPIIKNEEIQGELLVEIMIDEYNEVSGRNSSSVVSGDMSKYCSVAGIKWNVHLIYYLCFRSLTEVSLLWWRQGR